MAAWRTRIQYIGPIETIAPLVALLSTPERFRDRDVVLFIDNTGALFGIGKGDCHDADSGRLIHLFHCMCQALNVRVWVEHVPSGANISDLPSRDEFELIRKMGSKPVGKEATRFPDISLSLTEACRALLREFARPPSKAAKRHRAELEQAVESLRGLRPSKRSR